MKQVEDYAGKVWEAYTYGCHNSTDIYIEYRWRYRRDMRVSYPGPWDGPYPDRDTAEFIAGHTLDVKGDKLRTHNHVNHDDREVVR